MTIYPKLNARGDPSGSFIVEVTRQGHRTRRTVKGLQEAQGVEEALKATHIATKSQLPPVVTSASPRAYTIGDLARDSLIIWRGTKTESQSVQRFEGVCSLIGDHVAIEHMRPGDITTLLDNVVAELRGRGLTPATIHRYLAAFSAALRRAAVRSRIVAMPIIPWPKLGIRAVRDPMSKEDEDAVIGRLRKAGSPDVILVVDVLLATGARIGEVLGVDPNDIDEKLEQVTFRDTKNGRDRQVPLEADLCKRLWALATVGMPSYRRITVSLHSARQKAGMTNILTPHVLRHTVATRLSDRGVAITTIGKLLGHRHLKTTEGYIHPEQVTVRAAAAHLRRGNR